MDDVGTVCNPIDLTSELKSFLGRSPNDLKYLPNVFFTCDDVAIKCCVRAVCELRKVD